MEILRVKELKISKKNTEGRRKIINKNGLDIRLYGTSFDGATVGFMIVTKELKNDLKGWLSKCTYEEFKSGALEELSL